MHDLTLVYDNIERMYKLMLVDNYKCMHIHQFDSMYHYAIQRIIICTNNNYAVPPQTPIVLMQYWAASTVHSVGLMIS